MHALVVLGVVSLVEPVHSWYPFECCSDQDCEATDDVAAVPGGYRTHGLFVPSSQVRPSRDAQYHWCHAGTRIICFFAPATN